MSPPSAQSATRHGPEPLPSWLIPMGTRSSAAPATDFSTSAPEILIWNRRLRALTGPTSPSELWGRATWPSVQIADSVAELDKST